MRRRFACTWPAAMLMWTAVFAAAQGALAASPAEEARQIMQAVYDRDDGDDYTADVYMTLVDRNGRRSVRQLRVYRKNFGIASFHIYFAPAQQAARHSGLLSYDYARPGKDDDQWLYLPGMKKARRLTGDKSGSFMDSDFNFSDMTRPDMGRHTYWLMKQPKLDGVPTWQIQVLPRTREVARHSGYSKSMIWVRKDNLVVVRAIQWAHNSRRIKYFHASRLAQIAGVWVASEKQMVAREGNQIVHATILQFGNIKFDQKLNKRLFTVRSLDKGPN